MKYFVKFFVVTFFLLVCTHTFAEQRIVVLDMKFVLNNSKAGKEAQDYLKKTFNDNVKKFENMEKKLKEEENDLLGKRSDLTKEEFQKKSDELRKKVIDYQSKRRTALDKIAEQRATARQKLLDSVKPILDSYIVENDISLVIDKKNMLGGSTKNDITKQIVEKLNKELPSLNLK
mgnify:FL=1|tara:strand:+ start:937 stop:1461 length:525 start_codon:yes stop_codon:yes gene_type:complete